MNLRPPPALAVMLLLSGTVAAQIGIPTVVVGDPGNPAGGFFPNTFYEVGAVDYVYHIGTYEVTNAQYAAFLNAKASSDPHGLFRSEMQITRTGAEGAYTYSVAEADQNRPVYLVGFWDAARFCNWLTNGQGSGDTETGIYDLSDPAKVEANDVQRDPDAWAAGGVAIASGHEWVKAAHYQPAAAGGDVDGYWDYAIASNTLDPSMANYNGSVGATTEVGSYGDYPSYYGTFDQLGNVQEWTEEGGAASGRRMARGGTYNTTLTVRLTAGYAADYDPNHEFGFFEFPDLGFRVTSLNAIGGGGGSERGPVALAIRPGESGHVVLEVVGRAGDTWVLLHSPTLPATLWSPKTTVTLADTPFEFVDLMDEEGHGFYVLDVPASP